MLEKRKLIIICVVMALMANVLITCGYYSGIELGIFLGWIISVVMLMCVVSLAIDITRD
jgi:hypothetical protein